VSYVLLIIFLLFMLWYAEVTLRPVIYEMARIRAVKLATEAVNEAVQMKIADGGVRYNDLILIHKDSEGRIVLMQANTIKINQMAADVTLAVQKRIDRLRYENINIPMGQLTGLYILANLGPGLKVSIMPAGTVSVDVIDRFESAGVNQTRHSIYLQFETEVRIVAPLDSGEAKVATRVPVADSIIVGQVPETFLTLPWGIAGGIIK
jgi:sporulation protein YunB